MASNRYILVIGLLALAGLMAGCTDNVGDNSTSNSTNNVNSDNVFVNEGIEGTDSSSEVDIAPTVSITELRRHTLQNDCWVVYRGEVYDITSFLPRHPGGSRVLIPLCGTADEFETAFRNQHGTSKIETLLQNSRYMGILES
jgi:cytochrome b involved in lipid metabolism